MMRMFGKYGIDIRKEPILVYPTLHYQNGGLKITATAMTDVENLFVAGEAVGGIHGRNRLMGNSLLDIIVFGRNAGQQRRRQEPQRDPRRPHAGPYRRLPQDPGGGRDPHRQRLAQAPARLRPQRERPVITAIPRCT